MKIFSTRKISTYIVLIWATAFTTLAFSQSRQEKIMKEPRAQALVDELDAFPAYYVNKCAKLAGIFRDENRNSDNEEMRKLSILMHTIWPETRKSQQAQGITEDTILEKDPSKYYGIPYVREDGTVQRSSSFDPYYHSGKYYEDTDYPKQKDCIELFIDKLSE